MSFPSWLFVIGVCVLLPVLSLRSVRNAEAAGIGRVALYANVCLSLWLLAGICSLVLWMDGDTAADVHLRIDVIPGPWVAIAWTVILGSGGLLLFILSHRIGSRVGWQGEEAMLHRMRPTGGGEILWIVLILSPTAGFCEELVYRGFLVSRLQDLTGSATAATILSGAVFGLSHLYQGPWGALRAGMIGFLLTAPVLTLGTIVPSMAAHALIDALAIPLVWPLLERFRPPANRPPRRPQQDS